MTDFVDYVVFDVVMNEYIRIDYSFGAYTLSRGYTINSAYGFHDVESAQKAIDFCQIRYPALLDKLAIHKRHLSFTNVEINKTTLLKPLTISEEIHKFIISNINSDRLISFLVRKEIFEYIWILQVYMNDVGIEFLINFTDYVLTQYNINLCRITPLVRNAGDIFDLNIFSTPDDKWIAKLVELKLLGSDALIFKCWVYDTTTNKIKSLTE